MGACKGLRETQRSVGAASLEGACGPKEKAGPTGLQTGLLGLEPSAHNSQVASPQVLTKPVSPARTKYGTKRASETADDSDLAAVVTAWPELPEPVKAGIVAMVEVATKGDET